MPLKSGNGNLKSIFLNVVNYAHTLVNLAPVLGRSNLLCLRDPIAHLRLDPKCTTDDGVEQVV